jgi:hypothetical protein
MSWYSICIFKNAKRPVPLKNRNFLIIALIILCIEIGIALGVRDQLIRPLVGDVLATALLYSIFRGLFPWSKRKVTFATGLIAVLIEVGQALSLIEHLGLEQWAVARVVLGTSFDWKDLVAYAIGIYLMWVFDARILRLGRTDKS